MTPETDAITTKDKIGILMKEYDTLRAEILARTSGGFQLIAIGVGVFALLVQRQSYTAAFWASLGVGAAILVGFTFAMIRDILICAARIREIEAQVNKLANDNLLQWESIWGGAVTGIIWRKPPRKPN